MSINTEPQNTAPNNMDSESKSQNVSEIDWTKERAETWHKMQPPSRPAQSELEIYQKFFDKIKQTKVGAGKSRALILGSTVEFRQLAIQKEFDVTVVDYSRDYYNEISKEIPPQYNLDNEHYVRCDWCDMLAQLSHTKFDIIIGDLSVGNIPPESIDKFYENISNLLSDNGYLLGKSLYIYTDYIITANEMNQFLKDKLNERGIDKKNIYSHIMYPLSVYASENCPCSNNDPTRKIDFNALYNYIHTYALECAPKQKDIFSIYLDKATQFDKKMPKNFYIYSYQALLTQLAKHKLYIEDVEYSTEVYKNDFPLLIVRKGEDIPKPHISINTFLGENSEYLEKWKKAISSKYFLSNIENCISLDDLRNHVINLLDNAPIEIDKKLNHYISNIPEKTMCEETKSLTANTKIDNSEELKQELQFNYTCGILLSILNDCKIRYGIDSTLLDLILRTLFHHKTQVGKIWKPYESPWLSARICICLFPIYKQLKSKRNRTQTEDSYVNKLEEVVILLAEKKIEPHRLFWESETGSHFDTSALCIEVLYLYSKYINNQNLMGRIDAIIHKYVLSGLIKETVIRYPIFSSLVDEVCLEKNINGKPAYKKLGGRIEWYSILYIICKERGVQKSDAELTQASEYIAQQLRKFWGIFVERADTVIQKTINQEISLVPQILYCLKRTHLFD